MMFDSHFCSELFECIISKNMSEQYINSLVKISLKRNGYYSRCKIYLMSLNRIYFKKPLNTHFVITVMPYIVSKQRIPKCLKYPITFYSSLKHINFKNYKKLLMHSEYPVWLNMIHFERYYKF